jgi:hypothetical protein
VPEKGAMFPFLRVGKKQSLPLEAAR